MTYDFLSSDDEEIRRSAEQLLDILQDTELVNKTLDALFNDGWIPPNENTRELIKKMREEVESEDVNAPEYNWKVYPSASYGPATTGAIASSEFTKRYVNTTWSSISYNS